MEAATESKAKVKLIEENQDKLRKFTEYPFYKEKTKETVNNEVSAVTLVKSFMLILNKAKQDATKCTFKYMSSLWGLALRSLSIVETDELIKENIFDDFITSFLNSSEQIQQTAFPQLLNISEKIAQQSRESGDFFLTLINSMLTSAATN